MSTTFSRYTTKTLNTDGFDALSADVKHILYYLTLAGHACRDVIYMQLGAYGLAVRDVLLDIYYHSDLTPDERNQVEHDLFTVLACNGIYHDTQGDRLQPSFSEADFMRWCQSATSATNPQLQETARKGLFSKDVPNTLQESFVWQTGGVTVDERSAYLAHLAAQQSGHKPPLHGINLILNRRCDGTIEPQRYAVGQLFSEDLTQSCQYLESALSHANNYPALAQSIRTLIQFYQSGRPEDFDTHCEAWVRAQDSPVYFSQGFIERLEDPAKHIGSYQSLVGFKDPAISAQMDKICRMAQHLEDNLPIDPQFRREHAVGVMGCSVRLVSMHGAPAPVLPLGCVLPNNAWIRETVGSYSALFINVAEKSRAQDVDVLSRFIAPCHTPALKQYFSAGFAAMVSLHECAGHASGRMRPGVSLHDLGAVCNIIEEARADLVAYYFLGCPDVVAQILPEVTDHDAFAKAMYAEYLSQGTVHQLFRLPKGAASYGAATHFRSRQLNNAYVLERALLHTDAVRYVSTPFGACIEVLDLNVVRNLYGELLGEIQRIKSTGDKDAAELLVFRYGTHIDPRASEDAYLRIADLPQSAYIAFSQPFFLPTGDEAAPYTLHHHVDAIAGLR